MALRAAVLLLAVVSLASKDQAFRKAHAPFHRVLGLGLKVQDFEVLG